MADKKPRLVTPVGFAKWAHLHVPKAPFKGEADKGSKYMIDVCFSPEDPAWKAWAGELKRAIEALPPQTDKNTGTLKAKQMPIKRELDMNDQPTGRFYVTFKTGEKFKPGIFDQYGRVIPETASIGNESKIRVAYMASEYKEFGGGIALYLNAVQVMELVEYRGHSADAYGFQVEPLPAEMAGGPPLGAELEALPF